MAGSIPEDLRYTKDHEWVRQDGAEVVVGITDHAQRQLGDVVYVEIPTVGNHFEAGEPFGTVESVKAVSEVYTPVTGEVISINESMSDSPELINEDPYGEGWMIKVRMASSAPVSDLLTATEYADYIQEES